MSLRSLILLLAPAVLINYANFADAWLDMGALAEACLWVFALWSLLIVSSIVGGVVLSHIGLLEGDRETRMGGILGACLGITYGFLIWANVSGNVFAADKTRNRERLLDKAAEQLRVDKEPLTIPRLKEAMRNIEESESSDSEAKPSEY